MQLFQSRPVVSVYQPQRNAAFDAAILRGRLRFGNGRLFSRFESARALMRAVREGHGFFNLPDMDFGERDAAFVPFFGVPAATLLAPSRLARALDMVVQPVVAEVLPAARATACASSSRCTDFPSDDAVRRHGAHESLDRAGGATQARAVPVGAQALQDAATRRASALRLSGAG